MDTKFSSGTSNNPSLSLPFPPSTVEADDDAGGLSVGGPHALRADVPLGGAQVGAGGDGRAHGAAAEAPHQHHRADGRGRGRHAETGNDVRQPMKTLDGIKIVLQNLPWGPSCEAK